MRKRPPFLRLLKNHSSPSLPPRRIESPKANSWHNGALQELLVEIEEDVVSTLTTTIEKPVKVHLPAQNGESLPSSPSTFQNVPKESAPMASPDLPLSPLMDPKMIQARNRHRKPKPLATGPLSPFELDLKKSPYGSYIDRPIHQKESRRLNQRIS